MSAGPIGPAPDRPIEVRVVLPDGTPHPWDAEWFTEEEALEHLSGVGSPAFPADLDPAVAQDAYDSPWDHPEVLWTYGDGTVVRVSRVGGGR